MSHDWNPAETSAEKVASPAVPTAALVVIGDEILSGRFRDENSPWIIDRCRALGIDLCRIIVIQDLVQGIGREVAACSAEHDWVFTSGGVGPTHDDVTMEGIALGLDRPLERRPELVEVLARRMGDRLNEDALRMADVPAGAVLWWDGEISFPQVVAGNVVIFPGVPGLLRRKFDAVAHRFGGHPIESLVLTTLSAEPEFAASLRQAQARWPQVHIGSYPRFEQRPWTVQIILDSRDPQALSACAEWLRPLLG